MGPERLHELLGLGPLHIAISDRRLDRIDDLARESDIDIQNADGHTPLMLAVRHRYSEGVGALLSSGADPNIPDRRGRTPFQEAIRRREWDVADLLAQYGATRLHEIDGERCLHCGVPAHRVEDTSDCHPGSLEALRIQLEEAPSSCRVSMRPQEALRRGVPFAGSEHSRVLHLIIQRALQDDDAWEIHISPSTVPAHRYYGTYCRARGAPMDRAALERWRAEGSPDTFTRRETLLDIETFSLARAPVQDLLTRLSSVAIPVRPPNPPTGCEGHSVEISLGDQWRGARLNWWREGPAEWRELIDLAGEVQGFLTESRDAHRALRS